MAVRVTSSFNIRRASSVELRSKFGASSPMEIGPGMLSPLEVVTSGSGTGEQVSHEFRLRQVEVDHDEHQQQDHHEADLADDLFHAQGEIAADHLLDQQDGDLAAVEDRDRQQVHHRDADAEQAH